MSLFAELKRRNVLRVAAAYFALAWIILQFADATLGLLAAPDWAGRLVVVLVALGFIPALLLAWIYEITPKGVKRQSDLDLGGISHDPTARKLDLAVIVLLLIAISVYIGGRYADDDVEFTASVNSDVSVGNGSASRQEASAESLAIGVAVLPFANLSAEEENAFFAAGLHEDILLHLSRIADLRVISRTSVTTYTGSDLSLPAIGRALGVSHVIEGSVRRANGRVRVTVQLIDAATDEHVWAENYDRDLQDVFTIQSELARAIVGRIGVELSASESAELDTAPTTSTEAYDAYLRGLNYFRQDEGFEGNDLLAARYMEEALALDPDFRRAWLLLADIYSSIYWEGRLYERDYQSLMLGAIDQVRARWPESPELQGMLGLYHYRFMEDFDTALVHLVAARAAVSSDPSLLSITAFALNRVGRYADAIAVFNRWSDVDPANMLPAMWLSGIHFTAGDNRAGVAAAEDLVSRFPDSIDARAAHAQALAWWVGDIAPARALVEEHQFEQSWSLFLKIGFVRSMLADGRDDDALAALTSAADAESGDSQRARLWAAQILEAQEETSTAREYARVGRGLLELEVEGTRLRNETRQEAFAGIELSVALSLLGQHQRALELRERSISLIPEHDSVGRSDVRWRSWNVLARSHSVQAGWNEVTTLLDQSTPASPPWSLKFYPSMRHFFGELPEYQARVAALEDGEVSAP